MQTDASGSGLIPVTPTFSGYTIIDTLQRGGMGEVLLAERLREDGTTTRVVLKRLLAEHDDDERYVQMFLAESRVMSKLDHPNIVRVHDLPVIDGKQCIALEYVHGQNVNKILKRCHALGTHVLPQVALYIMSEVLKGLEYAHDFRLEDGVPLGLVHRDISPGNLLVSFDGEVKIIDFGIAKSTMSGIATTAGIVKGTTRYLSPEQIRGERVTARSDLFSCASVMVELLTGVPLFDRGVVPATLYAITRGQRQEIRKLLPFDAPALAAVLERALSLDPTARPPSALAMRLLLEEAAFEIGQRIDRAGLSVFLRDLFPEIQGPLDAFAGDLTYLIETRDPIQWASEKGNLPMIGARPLEAEQFTSGRPRPPPPPPLSDGALELPPVERNIIETRRDVLTELGSPEVYPDVDPELTVREERRPTPHPRPHAEAIRPDRMYGGALDVRRETRTPPYTPVPPYARPPTPPSMPVSSPATPAFTPSPPFPRDPTPATRHDVARRLRSILGALALFSAGALSALGVTRAIEPHPAPDSGAVMTKPVGAEPPARPVIGDVREVLPPPPEAPPQKASPRLATIDLKRPKGARVLLDGHPVTKRVPFSDLVVEPGPHTLTIITNRVKRTLQVDLEPGAHLDVSR